MSDCAAIGLEADAIFKLASGVMITVMGRGNTPLLGNCAVMHN